jgi:hypothetical protein
LSRRDPLGNRRLNQTGPRKAPATPHYSPRFRYQGTADYTDENDGADEEKTHQRRTEGSQSVVKKNGYQGTADYTDETDTADERKPHQCRTEGSQSAYIRVEPKVRNLWLKRTVTRGTADYADEKDGADEEKQHQRRTEGSQSVVKKNSYQGNRRLRG